MPTNKALKKLSKQMLIEELQASIAKLLETHGTLKLTESKVSALQEKVFGLEDVISDLRIELEGSNALANHYKEQLQSKSKERSFTSSVTMTSDSGSTRKWTKEQLRRGEHHGAVEKASKV